MSKEKLSDEETENELQSLRHRVVTGDSNFPRVLESSAFVDKTGLIPKLFDGFDMKLLAAPRQFGKTLLIGMLKTFLETEVDEMGNILSEDLKAGRPVKDSDNFRMFKKYNLKIIGNTEFMEKHFGKYPVLCLCLKWGQIDRFEDASQVWRFCVYQSYESHAYLLQNPNLSDYHRSQIHKILNCIFDETVTVDQCGIALAELAKMLKNHFDRPCIVLIDEYDAIAITATRSIKDREIVQKICETTNNVLKMLLQESSNYVAKGIIIGISNMVCSSYSGLNHITQYSFLQSPDFGSIFGFTKSEVDDLFTTFRIDKDVQERVHKYYNGYFTADNIPLFNPWAIGRFLQSNTIENFWAHTEPVEYLEDLFAFKSIGPMIFDLICAGKTEQELSNSMSIADFVRLFQFIHQREAFRDITADDRKILCTFLVEQGYFSAKKLENKRYCLTIPNADVQEAFQHLLDRHLNADINFRRLSLSCIKYFITISNELDDADAVKNSLYSILESMKSLTREYSKTRDINEALFSFIIVMLVRSATSTNFFSLQKSVWNHISHVFTDFCAIIHSIGYVFEFEASKKFFSSDKALEQIIDNKYYNAFVQKKNEWPSIQKCFIIGLSWNQSSDNYSLSMNYKLINIPPEEPISPQDSTYIEV